MHAVMEIALKDTQAAPAQDFDAAFAEFANAEAPVLEVVEEQPAASEEPAQAPIPEDKPSTEPESVKEPEDELTALRRKVADLQHAERSASARISSFHKKYNAAAAQVEELTRRLESAAPNSAAQSQPSDSEDDELAALSREMPELGRMVDRLVTKKVDETVGEVKSRVQYIEKGFVDPLREQAQQDAASAELALVAAEFPNWNEIVYSDEFKTWIAEKPPAIRSAWDQAATAADGLEFLRMYDREVSTPKQAVAAEIQKPPVADAAASKQRQLERSIGLPSRAAVKPAGGMPAPNDFESAFAYFASRETT
jgi:hypothetical protein